MSNGKDVNAVNAVEKAQKPDDNTVTLSTGVVVRGKQVPQLHLIKVMAYLPRPKIPVWFNASMGREMENPEDPDYIERVKEWKMASGNLMLESLILLGTEIVSIPKKMPGPNSDDWIDEYKTLRMEMRPESKNWRYLTWFTFKAAFIAADLDLIKEVVGRLSGVPEAKVDAAVQFPGRDQE